MEPKLVPCSHSVSLAWLPPCSASQSLLNRQAAETELDVSPQRVFSYSRIRNRTRRSIPPRVSARIPRVQEKSAEPVHPLQPVQLRADRRAHTPDRQNTSANAAEPGNRSPCSRRVLSGSRAVCHAAARVSRTDERCAQLLCAFSAK